MKRSGDRVIARDQVIGEHLRMTRGLAVPLTGPPDHQITRSWRVFLAALREIFDESAYDRFLSRTHSARSVASYRAFLREREAGIARKPRCC